MSLDREDYFKRLEYARARKLGLTNANTYDEYNSTYTSLNTPTNVLNYDSNSFKDIVSKINGVINDLSYQFGYSFSSSFEGLLDAGASIVSGVFNLFGNDKISNDINEFIKHDYSKDFTDFAMQDTFAMFATLIGQNKGKYNNFVDFILGERTMDNSILNDSDVGRMVKGVTQSLGRMAGAIATGGTLAGATGTLTAMGISAGGSSSSEALNDGANINQAILYGAASAGIEVLTEKIGGEWFGSGVMGAVGGKGAISKTILGKTSKTIAKEFLSEGIEEVMGDLLSPFAKMIYQYDGDKNVFQNWWKNFGDQGGFNGLLESFLSGGISGGIMSGINIAGNANNNRYEFNPNTNEYEIKHTFKEGLEEYFNSDILKQTYETKIKQYEAELEGKDNKAKKYSKEYSKIMDTLSEDFKNYAKEVFENNKNSNSKKIANEMLNNSARLNNALDYNDLQNNMDTEFREKTYDTLFSNEDGNRQWKYTKNPTHYDSKRNIVYINKGDTANFKSLSQILLHEKGHANLSTIDYNNRARIVNENVSDVEYQKGVEKLKQEGTYNKYVKMAEKSPITQSLIQDGMSKEQAIRTYIAEEIFADKMLDNFGSIASYLRANKKINSKGVARFKNILRAVVHGDTMRSDYKNAIKTLNEMQNLKSENYNDTQRYKIAVDENGKYVEVEDSEFSKILEETNDYIQCQKKLSQFLKEKYYGLELIYDGKRMTLNRNGRNKLVGDAEINRAKALLNLDELVKVSQYTTEAPKYKENSKYDKFYYYKTRFKINGRMYEGKVNLGKNLNENEYHIYDLNQIKEVGVSSWNEGVSTSSKSNINNNSKDVNKKSDNRYKLTKENQENKLDTLQKRFDKLSKVIDKLEAIKDQLSESQLKELSRAKQDRRAIKKELSNNEIKKVETKTTEKVESKEYDKNKAKSHSIVERRFLLKQMEKYGVQEKLGITLPLAKDITDTMFDYYKNKVTELKAEANKPKVEVKAKQFDFSKKVETKQEVKPQVKETVKVENKPKAEVKKVEVKPKEKVKTKTKVESKPKVETKKETTKINKAKEAKANNEVKEYSKLNDTEKELKKTQKKLEKSKEALAVFKEAEKIHSLANKFSQKVMSANRTTNSSVNDNVIALDKAFTKIASRKAFSKSFRSDIGEISKYYTEDSSNEGFTTIGIEYNEEIKKLFEEVAQGKGKITAEELKEITTAFKVLYKSINEYANNQVWHNGKLVNIDETSKKYYDIYDKNTKLRNGAIPTLVRKLYSRFADPQALFSYLDNYNINGNGFFSQMYEDLTKAQNNEYKVKLDLLKDLEKYNKTKYVKHLNETKTFQLGNGLCENISYGQLISILNTAKDVEGFKHIQSGGLYWLNEKGTREHWKHENIDWTKTTQQDFIEMIEKQLTAEDLKYAITIDNVLDKAKKYKKEKDIQMYGVSNVKDGYYYPLSAVAENFTKQVGNPSASSFGDMKSAAQLSFNKTRKSNFGGVFIHEANTLIDRYISGLSRYYAYASEVQYINRVLNNTFIDVDGKNKSLKYILAEKNIFNITRSKKSKQVDFNSYIHDYLNDIQSMNMSGNNDQSGFEKLISKVRKNSVVATLGLNVASWFKQTASYVGAVEYISPKYLAKAFGKSIFLNKTSTEIQNRNSYIAMRFADNEYIKGSLLSDSYSKFQQATMKPITQFDKMTISKLFIASQYQVEANHKGDANYKFGTEANMQEASDLLEKVVRGTQPNYNSVERSAGQRTKSEVERYFYMYATQPLKNFSRLSQHLMEVNALNNAIKNAGTNTNVEELKTKRNKAVKGSLKSLSGIVAQGIVYTLIGQLIKSLIKKKDWDEWSIQNFTQEVFENSIIGMLPIIKDLYGFFAHNYDFSIISMDNVNEMLGGIKAISDGVINQANGEEVNWAVNLRKFVLATSNVAGIPTKNLWDYTHGIIANFSPETAYKMRNVFYPTNSPNKDYKEYLSKGKEEMASTILEESFKNDKTGKSPNSNVIKEINYLVKNGYENVIPSNIATNLTVDGATYKLTSNQKKKIMEEYSKANDIAYKVISSKEYGQLSDEYKARLLKLVYSSYYDYAKKSIVKDYTTSNKYSILVANMPNNIDKLFATVVYSNTLVDNKKLTRKEQVQRYINKSSLTKEQKYLAYRLSGYTLSKRDRQTLIKYLKSIGLTNEEINEIL